MLNAIWIFAPLVALCLRRQGHPGRPALAALVTGAAFLVTAALTYRSGLAATGDPYFHDTYHVHVHISYLAPIGAVYAALALPLWAIHRWRPCRAWGLWLFLAFHVAVILIILPIEALTSVGMPRRYVDYPQVFHWINLAATAGAILGALVLTLTALMGLYARWCLVRARARS